MQGRNVLIFHSGALGDFVLTWPLAMALCRLYPQSRIVYVTQRSKGELAERVLRVEYADTDLGWHRLFGDPLRLPEPCKKRLDNTHAIVTYLAKEGDTWMQSVRQLNHSAELFAAEALPPVLAGAVEQMVLAIATRGLGNFRFPNPGPIAIHPGAGSPDKCWPLESYLHLADLLRKSGRACKFIVGEVELEKWTEPMMRSVMSVAPLAKPTNYVGLLNELTSSAGFIGNDSGPGHLAGIIGLPSLILFGPTDPGFWKPRGPRVQVLRKEPLDQLEAEEVYKLVP